jgi:hypothetical protein
MHRRREFSTQTKRDAYSRSGGICECHRIPWLERPKGCGVKLVTGAIFYEHIICDFHCSDNSLSNAAVLCRTCWKEKTARFDIPSIAKTKRLIDSVRGINTSVGRPLPGTIRSGIKLSFRGPIDRRTGLPWRTGS